MDLDELRRRLAELDRDILKRVARRQALAAEIGAWKRRAGRGTRDFAQERLVVERARAAARELGAPPELAERLMLLLIRSSLTVQEQERVAADGGGRGRRALVIGGAGSMGRWMTRFLLSQGFAVEVADPAGAVDGVPHHADWRATNLDHDLIVVAATLRASNAILLELAGRRPPGVVFDIGSLKTPLREGLLGLARAGARVTSLHPMFGPDTELLSGRHVILVDVGSAEATATARALFEPTMATLVEMELDAHDRMVAFVLGLSHATNIAFFSALAGSGEDAPRLAGISSTTFDAQLAIARRVAQENPRLYFEIQHANAYGGRALEALGDALARLTRAVRDGDEAAFTALMERGREYLRVQTREPHP